MLISRKKVIESQIDRGKCPIRLSTSIIEAFKEASRLDGFKNYSDPLENLLEQFLNNVNSDDDFLVSAKNPSDRANKSFQCSLILFQDFVEKCNQLQLNKPEVLELICTEYIKQAEKDHKIILMPEL